MITIRMANGPNDPAFQECLDLVARLYKEELGLPGFDKHAAAPDVFIYAMEGERIVGTEGLAFANPTFTELNLIDGVRKVEKVLGKPREELTIAESCRSVTLPEYTGVFAVNLAAAALYLHTMCTPRVEYVVSSIKPGLVEALKKHIGLPYIHVKGEWDLSKIPKIYREWYLEKPPPIAAIHDVAVCYKISSPMFGTIAMELEP